MILTFDIDGVIANIQQEFVYRLKQDFDIRTSEEEWNKDHKVAVQFPEVPESWVDEQFADSSFYLNAIAYESAWFMINKWFMSGHDVFFITCRGERYNKNATALTERWLDEWEVNYNMIYHSETRLEKYKTCLDLGADLFVEDDPHEVKVAAEHLPSYLVEHAYNAGYDIGKGTRIASLYELDNLIMGDK